jgi:hypothetical protein
MRWSLFTLLIGSSQGKVAFSSSGVTMFQRLSSFVVLLVAAGSVNAQFAPKQGGYPTHLLPYPAVQKDLGISAITAKKVAGIFRASQKRYLAMISPTPSHPNNVQQPTSAQVAAEVKRTEAELIVLLNAKQRARLREIGIQSVGAFGLTGGDLGATLKITPAQRKKLTDAGNRLRKEFQAKMNGVVKAGHVTPKNRTQLSETRQKLTEARFVMMRKLAAEAGKILTGQQMAQWRRLQGKPFPIETLFGPPSISRA